LLALAATNLFSQQSDFPKLTGPYLDQKPPGRTPEIFAPGIISVEENFEHSAAVFSPDNQEVVWCTNINWYTDKKVSGNMRLYYMKIVDGKWTAPEIFPATKDNRVERPVFSPDGKRLYFEYGRATENIEGYADIYFVERKGEGWSEPKPVSPLINSPAMERLLCVTADGSLYFSRNVMLRDEEMFVSRFIDGTFTNPKKLDESYDSEAPELAMVFGPHQEYMLIAQLVDRSCYAYVSYKNADGTWSKRIKTPYECGGFLSLSPDSKYLFFLGEGIIWVSTSFIEELRPKK
jgi:Tol biopolymer transport system component